MVGRRQINCKHYLELVRKTSVYTYNLTDFELNLCNRCERKLRKQILEQIELEKSLKRANNENLQK